MPHIYLLSRDLTWSKAVIAVLTNATLEKPIRCSTDCADLDLLPAAEPDALLLVDAMECPQIVNTVSRLKELGWDHIVVFAADPSEKDARAVIHAGAQDYLIKFYSRTLVRKELEECLKRLASSVRSGIPVAKPDTLSSSQEHDESSHNSSRG